MKLLIDNALSPRVAVLLTQAGYDALHVRDAGMQRASDEELLALAEREDRVVVSADTDFGTLLTLRRQTRPSFILLRGDIERRPEQQGELLIRELPGLTDHLEAGAIIVISRSKIRIRLLATPPEQ